MANSWRAKARGERLDWVKSMEEKDTRPEETSGVLDKVEVPGAQVMVFASEVAMSATSAGRAVVPVRKQGVDWRAVGAEVARAMRLRRVRVWACIVAFGLFGGLWKR